MPKDVVQPFIDLLARFHYHMITALFKSAQKSVETLVSTETWLPEVHCNHTQVITVNLAIIIICS